MDEFWNESLTAASWEKLQELSKKYAFTVIGGWAIYLWTKKQKSRDIDIVVGYGALEKLKQDYALSQNNRLRKYEIKTDKFDIDIYVEYYSKLEIPPEELETTAIDGITVVSAENLLVLKQGAEKDRRGTSKGKKDAIDIMQLLLSGSINFAKYAGTLEKYGLGGFEKELELVISRFDVKDLKYLGKNFKEFRKWQRETLGALRKIK